MRRERREEEVNKKGGRKNQDWGRKDKIFGKLG